MKQFSSFCKKCQKNICIDCEEEHKNHEIYNFDILIVLEDDLYSLSIFFDCLKSFISSTILL